MSYKPYLEPTPEVEAQREHFQKQGYMPTYLKPDFQQSVDWSRPVELLTEDTKWSGSLVYRHTDNGETVTVPNIWYNQPASVRASTERFNAEREIAWAVRIETEPSYHWDRKLGRAEERRAKAKEMLDRAERFEEDARMGRPPFDMVKSKEENR